MLCPCINVGFDLGRLRINICGALLDSLREAGVLKHPINPGSPTNPAPLPVGGISIIDVSAAQIEVPNGSRSNFSPDIQWKKMLEYHWA